MGSSEDDTTYSYVGSSGRPPSKRKTPKTVRAGADPPSQDEAKSSDEPGSDVDPSRNVLGAKDVAELVERGEYQKVCDLLGPADRAADLPPALTLLYIVSRGELAEGPELADLPHLAMETSGKLLGMPARSRASRLVAKRLLGLSSADVRRRMPSAAVRMGLIAAGLLIGLIVGWVAGPGGVNLAEVFESLTR